LFADTTSLGLMSSLFDELLPHDEKMTARHITTPNTCFILM